MQERDSLEQIVGEVCELMPELREREAEVREVVATLLSVRPTVAIDGAFVARLRDELAAKAKFAPLSSSTSAFSFPISWWAVRAVPVGVLAVLMLAILGGSYGPRSAPGVPNREGERYLVYPRASSHVGGGESTLRGSSAAQDMMATDSAMPLGAPESVSSKMMPVSVSGNMLDVPEQVPGNAVVLSFITLTGTAFVEIVTVEPTTGSAARIGVSPLLSSGTHTSLAVPLERATEEGRTYHARLWEDNGDGVFDEADEPLRDFTGQQLFAVFSVRSEAVDMPVEVMPMPAQMEASDMPQADPFPQKTF